LMDYRPTHDNTNHSTWEILTFQNCYQKDCIFLQWI
jgi:hypothetical protein